jgi:hypothetical protein
VTVLGPITSFHWYAPTGVQVLRVLGSSQGDCRLSGLSGFGGDQFKTILLYPNIFCDKVDLKPPSCTNR